MQKISTTICEKYRLPRFVFVTDMDIDNASFRQVVSDMTLEDLVALKVNACKLTVLRTGHIFHNIVKQRVDTLTQHAVAPFHLPIRENEKFVGYINVITEQAYRWEGKEVVECDMPEYSKDNLQLCRD